MWGYLQKDIFGEVVKLNQELSLEKKPLIYIYKSNGLISIYKSIEFPKILDFYVKINNIIQMSNKIRWATSE